MSMTYRQVSALSFLLPYYLAVKQKRHSHAFTLLGITTTSLIVHRHKDEEGLGQTIYSTTSCSSSSSSSFSSSFMDKFILKIDKLLIMVWFYLNAKLMRHHRQEHVYVPLVPVLCGLLVAWLGITKKFKQSAYHHMMMHLLGAGGTAWLLNSST